MIVFILVKLIQIKLRWVKPICWKNIVKFTTNLNQKQNKLRIKNEILFIV